MKPIRKVISFALVICMLASMAPAAYAVGEEHDLAYVSTQGNIAAARLMAERDCSQLAAQYAEDGQLLGGRNDSSGHPKRWLSDRPGSPAGNREGL